MLQSIPFEVTQQGNLVRLKPDIVIWKDGDVKVIDVAITYESGDSIKRVVDEKIGKYSALKDCLLERF